MSEHDPLPQYTIRVKPTMKKTPGVDLLAYGDPVVMLVDEGGHEVARLMGISDVTVAMGARQFANVSVSFGLFEVEGVAMMINHQRRAEEAGV